MERDRLVLAIGSVLAGLTVLLAVLGVTYSPLFVAAAVPFGLAAYLMWYQATGRLAARVRARPRGQFEAGESRFRGRARERSGPRSTAGPRERQRNQRRATPPSAGSALSRSEALDALGLEEGADEGEIKRAYRERVKEVHPDTEGGDEESFKRVNRAYETLLE